MYENNMEVDNMKSSHIKRIVSATLICSVLVAFAACNKEPEETTTLTTPSSETIPTIATTTTEQETLPIYDGPLETSDTVETRWTETELPNQLTLYAHVSAGNFLRVRRGPGTDYEIAGTLTRGQTVVVVASTNNNWYKTEDGFYVSGEYVKTSEPT